MSRRKRITITVRENLLRGVDQLIDTAKIRNRSHAIEVLLQRGLGHGARQAVILAAGEGVQLRPFTTKLPKPLLPVGGRPLLAHTLSLLNHHNIRDIVMVTGHLGDHIEHEFGTGEALGMNLRYVVQRETRGTGGALLAARPAITTSPFLCLYADTLADLDLTDLIRAHESSEKALATIALTSVANPSAYGAVRLHGTRVAEFLEKPSKRSDVSRLVFAGISVLEEEVFAHFPKGKSVSFERDVFPGLVKRRALFGYPFEGTWFDVSTTAVYERALKTWPRARA